MMASRQVFQPARRLNSLLKDTLEYHRTSEIFGDDYIKTRMDPTINGTSSLGHAGYARLIPPMTERHRKGWLFLSKPEGTFMTPSEGRRQAGDQFVSTQPFGCVVKALTIASGELVGVHDAKSAEHSGYGKCDGKPVPSGPSPLSIIYIVPPALRVSKSLFVACGKHSFMEASTCRRER